MSDPLAQAADRFPDCVALVAEGVALSYAKLSLKVQAAAAVLHRLSVGAGRHVALVSINDPREVVLLHAFWRLGAVVCPLSFRLPPQAIGECTELLDAALLVVPDTGTAGIPGRARVLPLRDIIGTQRSASGLPCAVVDPDRDATIVMTSGTTAHPKAVLHALSAHLYSARGSNANIALAPGDRWLLSLPLSHVGGLAILFRAALAGATVAVPTRGQSLADAIAHYRPTHLSVVPTQLRDLLTSDLSEEHFAHLSAVLIGGSSIPADLIDRALELSLPVHTSYGLTEMASQVTTTARHDPREWLRTSGRPLAHRELRVRDDGTILVRGKPLFRGYIERGGEVHLPIDDEGWFATGDTGHVDTDGCLTVFGRSDNMFVSGGENIHPEETEAVLCRIPEVLEAVVVPVADQRLGSRSVAFVRTRSGELPADLAERLTESLPRFKVPKRFFEWPCDSSAESVKPNRRALRDLAERLATGAPS